jgi:hypothetical protein
MKGQTMTGLATTGSVKALVSIANQPETAEIAVEGADQERNIITIENTLIDKHAQEVHLNPGANVEVTIRAHAAAIRPREPWPGTPDGKQY